MKMDLTPGFGVEPEFEGSSVFNQKVKRLENTLNIAKLKKNPIFSRSDLNKIAIT